MLMLSHALRTLSRLLGSGFNTASFDVVVVRSAFAVLPILLELDHDLDVQDCELSFEGIPDERSNDKLQFEKFISL